MHGAASGISEAGASPKAHCVQMDKVSKENTLEEASSPSSDSLSAVWRWEFAGRHEKHDVLQLVENTRRYVAQKLKDVGRNAPSTVYCVVRCEQILAPFNRGEFVLVWTAVSSDRHTCKGTG